MELILTNWGPRLVSKLINTDRVLSKEEFEKVIKPDVLLLKDGYPSPHKKFNLDKFWGPAKNSGVMIQNAYKMKWHNIGTGRVQLRLCVIILNHKIYICNGYVKDDKSELREMAKLKLKIDKINRNNFTKLGIL